MFKAIVGDRGRPFFAVLVTGDGNPVDLSSSTCTLTMKNAAGTTKISAAACTVEPGQTFTVDTSLKRIVAQNNKASDGDPIYVSNSGGALPTNLAASTWYYVKNRNAANFSVSATPGGPEIDLTGAGTGTHTFKIVGSVQYPWTNATDVDTADTYGVFIQETVGGLIRTYPVDVDGIHRGFPVEIRSL